MEQLEILLLLADSPAKEWTAAAVYEIVRSSERSVAERLEEFMRQGFLKSSADTPPAYRYAPKHDTLRAGVAETARLYLERRVSVTKAIFSPEFDPHRGSSEAPKLPPS